VIHITLKGKRRKKCVDDDTLKPSNPSIVPLFSITINIARLLIHISVNVKKPGLGEG
jgi:hypothetical protein